MDRQEIENEVIDYKSNGKILSVMSKDEKYQILTASIYGDLLERQELHNLLILATGNLEFQYDETRLYDEDFIDHLRNIFFTIYHSKPTNQSLHHIPILLSIEGNIGAGKSTLLRKLKELHPEWTFIDEPVDTWTQLRNEKGNLLENFYQDQSRWAYTFQNCSILSRYQLIESSVQSHESQYPGKHIYITERCLGTDYHVFTKMLFDDQKLQSHEYELYTRWLDHLQQTSTPLSGIIYVDTNPEVCLERIKLRSRDGEDCIPLEYLNQLDTYQSRWIQSETIPCIQSTSLEEIREFVNSLLAK